MVRFELPEEAHYSERFLSCRRPDSPWPREEPSTASKLKSKVKEVKTHLRCRRDHYNNKNATPTPGNGKKGSGFYALTDLDVNIDGAPGHDAETGPDRSWDDVLEWMHREGVNVAGMKMSEEERNKCITKRMSGEKCGCLGPLGR